MVARSLNFLVIGFSSLMVYPDKVHKLQSVRRLRLHLMVAVRRAPPGAPAFVWIPRST